MLAIPARLFTKLADLIYAVKRLHQSTNDWRSLVSQCLLLFTVSLKFHLTEAPMSGFLTDFPTDFDPSDFSTDFDDRFPGAGCHPSIGRGLTCKDRWSVRSFEASGRIFMTNNSPAAISNACYTALRNNFDPFIQMTTINGAHFNRELNIHPSTFNICQLWEKVREPYYQNLEQLLLFLICRENNDWDRVLCGRKSGAG